MEIGRQKRWPMRRLMLMVKMFLIDGDDKLSKVVMLI